MSFYTQDEDISQRRQQFSFQTNANTETCPICNSTSFYRNSSGRLTCSECFTQSQTQTHLEEDEWDPNRTNIRTSKRIKSQRYIPNEALDKSVPLPDLDVCMEGMVVVLKEMTRQTAVLCGVNEEKLLEIVKRILFGWISSWSGGAEVYGRKNERVRFSLRDCFLSPPNLVQVNEFVEKKSLEQLMQEEVERDETMRDVRSSSSSSSGSSSSDYESSSDSSSSSSSEDESSKQQQKKKAKIDDDCPYRPTHLRHQPFRQRHLKIHTILPPKGPITPHEAALRLKPSLFLLLSIIHSSLLHFHAGVSSSHLRNWVRSGHISYMSTWRLLPPQLQTKLSPIQKFFERRSFPGLNKLEQWSELVGIASGVPWPESMMGTVDNAPLMMARFIKDLALDQTMLDRTFSLMGVADTEQETGLLPPLECTHRSRLVTPAHVLAVLIVAIKCTDQWETWKCRASVSPSKRFIPWKEMQLRCMTNGNLMDYFQFLETTFFDPKVSTKLTTVLDRDRKDTTTVVELDSEDDEEEDYWNDEPTEIVRPNRILAGDNSHCHVSSKNVNQHQHQHQYLSYQRHHNRSLWEPPQPFHPYYGLLMEFVSCRFHIPVDCIHRLVCRMDQEVVRLGLQLKKMKKKRVVGGETKGGTEAKE